MIDAVFVKDDILIEVGALVEAFHKERGRWPKFVLLPRAMYNRYTAYLSALRPGMSDGPGQPGNGSCRQCDIRYMGIPALCQDDGIYSERTGPPVQ